MCPQSSNDGRENAEVKARLDMQDPLIKKVAELALEAEESGRPNLGSALMHVVRASTLPPGIARMTMNTCVMVLDTVLEVMKRRGNDEPDDRMLQV